jgi:hypothetical protein
VIGSIAVIADFEGALRNSLTRSRLIDHGMDNNQTSSLDFVSACRA